MNPNLSVVVIYPKKAEVHGLQQDALLIETSLGIKVRHADPLEPPVRCDVAIHLEIPIYGWMPWAEKNICMINPEWWNADWNPYLEHMDLLLFKCQEDAQRFSVKKPYVVLPWTSPVSVSAFEPFQSSNTPACLLMAGASLHKRMAAEKIVSMWKPEWPPLHVCSQTPLTSTYGSNVTVDVKDLSTAERLSLQAFYPCHIVISASEALSLVAHEGMAAGAFLIANSLPTYKESLTHAFLVPSTLVPKAEGLLDTFETLCLDDAISAFLACDMDAVRKSQKKAFRERKARFKRELLDLPWIHIENRTPLPPVIADADLPSISILTLLYNRRKFVDLSIHNLILSDYPKDKIEWVVVEDSDDVNEQASDKIIQFGRNAAPMSVTYIPLEGKTEIGEKRNIGVNRAQHEIVLMMDDDDHYPQTSFRRRVSWLLQHPWAPKACVCTTIACYDLVRGVSAVNSPPFTLGLKQRISEATLIFKKSWWEEKKFPQVSMAEGEGFLEGREHQVLELPPQQCIVAFSHGKNKSSRRIPEGNPSCFWGFPQEYLTFIHGLAGVSVEA
jgi:hypothetical protein